MISDKAFVSRMNSGLRGCVILLLALLCCLAEAAGSIKIIEVQPVSGEPNRLHVWFETVDGNGKFAPDAASNVEFKLDGEKPKSLSVRGDLQHSGTFGLIVILQYKDAADLAPMSSYASKMYSNLQHNIPEPGALYVVQAERGGKKVVSDGFELARILESQEIPALDQNWTINTAIENASRVSLEGRGVKPAIVVLSMEKLDLPSVVDGRPVLSISFANGAPSVEPPQALKNLRNLDSDQFVADLEFERSLGWNSALEVSWKNSGTSVSATWNRLPNWVWAFPIGAVVILIVVVLILLSSYKRVVHEMQKRDETGKPMELSGAVDENMARLVEVFTKKRTKLRTQGSSDTPKDEVSVNGGSTHNGAQHRLLEGSKCRLKGTSGAMERQIIDLEKETLLGREGDIVVDDEYVSRKHAVVRPASGGFEIVDLQSTDGTKVNGTSLTPHVPHRLAIGDVIAMGDTMLVVSDPKETNVRPTQLRR